MPGLIVFRRRWSVGSDDLVVPGVFLLTIHVLWIFLLLTSLLVFDYDLSYVGVKLLWFYQIGYIFILFVSAAIELTICIISMRGSILETKPRASMHVWIYLKSVVIFFDVAWSVLGVLWISKFYFDTTVGAAKEIILGLLICNWLLVLTILITIWCTFDAAGRSWVKMKKYQRSMRESESRFNYKRSGSMNRNWRQRKVIRAYQDSWDHRCRLLFCCMGGSERNRNSFADIARLLSDFFRELDVVPSDVVAGLVLLRKFQKLEREAIVRQRKNGIFEFLSGVPITEKTQFLALHDVSEYSRFQTVIRYMYFAQGAYGWPMYLMTHRSGVCHLCPEMRCCYSCCGHKDNAEIIRDNCCRCNYAALKKMLEIGDVEVIYATYHVDIGETPFFVAIDYSQHKIVISIRGTLSMKDVLTDLNAEGDVLPLDPPREDWLGHKGMVQAAIYIKKKLEEEDLIQKAMAYKPTDTQTFGLVLVGHSLGAGTASILAIMLKPQYPTLECYSYSPPGGLLSMPAVEYSKSFITSVVVGKDVVPRIGLHQMEALRADLINAIKRSIDPKWKTITCSVICCGCGAEPSSVVQMSSKDTNINQYEEQKNTARTTSAHPTDSSIALTLHQPLYPPGRIIHVVRNHPKSDGHKYERVWRQAINEREPVYQAIWADTTDFDEVLISPVMLQDHMPDKVLTALNKVVTTVGPPKPRRQQPITYGSPIFDSLDAPKSNFFKNTTLQTNTIERNRTFVPKYVNNEYMLKIFHNFYKESSFTTSCSRPGLDRTDDILFDPLHNDLFGLAPLASPESLSEISSISSRKYSCNGKRNQKQVEGAEESQFFTPKIMRRAPKIMTNLSTCGDDWKSVEQYRRMGQVFVTSQRVPLADSDSVSSIGSTISMSSRYYEKSKSSFDKIGKSMTIENNIIEKENILSGSRASKTCNRLQSHCAYEHVSAKNNKCTLRIDLGSHNGIPLHSNIKNSYKPGILESHFPVYSNNFESTNESSVVSANPVGCDSIYPVQSRNWESQAARSYHCNHSKPDIIASKHAIIHKKDLDDRSYFDHVYLSSMTEKSGYASPDFLIRKKCVFPVRKSVSPFSNKINESNV